MKNKKIDINIFRDICKKNGLKLTPQREIIFLAISGNETHPSAELIYRQTKRKLSNITFDTVNRTLKTFSKIGIINFVSAYSSFKRYDPIINIHQHCYCIKCNKIFDIYYEPYNRIKLPNKLPAGFKGKKPVIIIEGVCKDCS